MEFPWEIRPNLSDREFAAIRRRAIFECFKWDTQVEDVTTLAAFPLVINQSAWQQLTILAEQLAQETLAAEQELLIRLASTDQSTLQNQLTLPRAIYKLLQNYLTPLSTKRILTTQAARLMRFDFHYTTTGWQISEANTDVPGGFNEASGFSQLIAEHYPDLQMVGDPAGRMAARIAQITGEQGTVALVHATAYSDDHQVMKYLAKRLEPYHLKSYLVSPAQMNWRNNQAYLNYPGSSDADRAIDMLVRFFPTEWLPNLPKACGWTNFFYRGNTPLCNPATAILTQTKRFPLTWRLLKTALPTWQRLLPETYDPREVTWQKDQSWVLKPALGRVGEGIRITGVTSAKEIDRIDREIAKHPELWVAQRRFEIVPLIVDGKKIYPCIGVYTLDNAVIGAYGRISEQPLINQLAQDIAVLTKH